MLMTCECLNDIDEKLIDEMEVIILREVYEAVTLMPLSSRLGTMAFKMPRGEYDLMIEGSTEWYKMNASQRIASQSWDGMRWLYRLFKENSIGINFYETYVYIPLATSSLPKLARELLKLIKPRLYS
jgi:hypothetical protein